jgi:beta-glucosidase
VQGDPQKSGPRYQVSFDVTNTGSRAGTDVAEAYVGESHPKVPRPAKELKGFAKVNLQPGETKHVTIPLNARSFSYYDVAAHEWRVDPGDVTIFIGRSVDDTELKSVLTITPSAASSLASKP